MNHTLINNKLYSDKPYEEIMMEQNMPLVHSCVRKLYREGMEYDDLLQLGSIGLIKAIRRFDPTLGNQFSTYAVPLILGEIRRYLRDDGIIKVSRSLKEIKLKATRAQNELVLSLGRDPTIGEIAGHLNINKEKLILALDACLPCESLQKEMYTSENSDFTLGDTIKDPVSFNHCIERIELKSALDTLEARERKIMILRYFGGKTQAEISKIIGVSQVQISRIEKKVLCQLRKKLA